MAHTSAVPPARSPASRLPWLAFAVALVASRIPLLFNGYGSDNDSWRNVVAVLRMQAAGHYAPSRVPGFPLFEGIMALLVPLGPLATNGVAIAASLLAVYFFHRICTKVLPRSAGWLTLGFAFGGPIWVQVAQSMDYAYGILFFLIAYDAALSRRYTLAALMLGLATGTRATYVLMALPFLLLLRLRREPVRLLIEAIGTFALTVLLLFLPVMLTRDPETTNLPGRFEAHFLISHAAGMLLPAARAGTVFLFGKFGTAAVVLAVLLALGARLMGMGKPAAAGEVAGEEARIAVAFDIGVVVVVTGFYLAIPYEGAYLLPMLPSVMLLLARLLSRPLLIAVVLVLLLECFVSLEPREGRQRVVPGRLLSELSTRRADLDSTAALAALEPAGPTVYVVGQFAMHRYFLLHRDTVRPTASGWASKYWQGVGLWSTDGRRAFAAVLAPDQQDSLARAGWSIVDRRPKVGLR
jgi:hypothetical protein